MKKRFSQTGTSTTKNETSTRKLKLAKETLRSLNAPELARVAGGQETALGGCISWETCDPPCVSTQG